MVKRTSTIKADKHYHIRVIYDSGGEMSYLYEVNKPKDVVEYIIYQIEKFMPGIKFDGHTIDPKEISEFKIFVTSFLFEKSSETLHREYPDGYSGDFGGKDVQFRAHALPKAWGGDVSEHIHECPFIKGLHWHKYRYLESKLVDVTKIVTLDEENYQSWGEGIADLLVLTGNAMDTFFKDMHDCPNIREDEIFKSINQPRNKWGITDYRKVYEPYYQLSKNPLLAQFGLGKEKSITPFENFACQKPEWWDAYNDTKHEFYSKMSEANLGNTLKCLGGLLILNALHLCSSYYLSLSGEFSASPRIYGRLGDQTGYMRELTRSKIGISRWGRRCQIITQIFTFSYRVDENIGVRDPSLLDFVAERYLVTE